MFNKKLLADHPMVDAPVSKEGSYYQIVYEKYDKDTLVINIFQKLRDNNEYLRAYRVFQRECEYITQDGKEITKWYTGSIERLTSVYWYSCEEFNTDVAKEFCNKWNLAENKAKQIRSIMYLQSCLMEVKREKKYAKERELIDKEMEKFGELPKGTEEFFIKKVFIRDNFIFYDKKNSNGYCTNCEKEISLVSLKGDYKHKQTGKCPECRKPITFYSKGISHKYLKTEGTGVVFQHKNGELLARYFNIIKYYGKDIYKPIVDITEVVRTIFTDQTCVNYEFRSFHQGAYNWCKCKPYQERYYFNYDVRYNSHRNYDYFNLARAIKGTPYQYSEVVRYMSYSKAKNRNNAYSPENYLSKYVKHPILEKLVKLGMMDIAKEWLRKDFETYSYRNRERKLLYNPNEKELHKMLGLSKEQLKVLNSVKNPSCEFYECLKENNTGKIYTREQYLLVNEKCNSLNNCKRMFDLLNRISYKKVMRYLERNDTDIYLDYIEFCTKLGYDLKNSFVAFPKDLQAAHDEAMALVKEDELKEEFEKINSMLPELAKKFNFKFKDLVIIAPTNAKDLVRESQALHNCISRNYIKPFSEGKCAILFIRHVADINKPFFAMEVSSNGRVVQVRGMNNCQATEEVKSCVESFKKKKLKAA